MTRAVLAIQIYRQRHGRVPPSLADLKEYGLTTVPVDSFDGAPLRYDSGRKIIWSVSRDGKDDGGMFSKPLSNEPDLGVQL